ncbi:Protein CBG23244 [Caenorhabditis briggsae]|uniref:Protein CBG23244 n=2 Tax=Caenorhabditis briggsae TaxID=6238 RepID=A8Y4D5_CAEBR|nr:Protein CBG23244 [Caenorhabditis briggsae]ULT89093.1 hypothetical protein L3Y34_007930 [Caenorhabditis briggsae]CAP39755.1 Protein CBG23244 [Caenorhabditis briggsae]
MDVSDAAAGMFLLILGIVGCTLYGLIISAMWKMIRDIVGFRFLISQALTDILLMIQFGIWPGIVILTQNEIINEAWRHNIHIYLNFTWWAMVYHYTVIAWSRLAAVQWPNWFRTLPYGTSILICALPWFAGLLQSLVEHQFAWFTPLYYSPSRYGMHSDWEQYQLSGTDTYYMLCNVVLMVVPFPLYVLALAVLFQRNTSRNLQLRSKYSHAPIATSSYVFQQKQLSIETRLLVPCIINTVLFVIGQVFITQCSKHGKWMNWAVMVVFATNSFVNPLLYLFFSSVIRKGVISTCQKNFSLSAIYYDYEGRSSPRTSSIVMKMNHRDSTITSHLNCRVNSPA